MLRVPGPAFRLCDGLSRRSFLQIGGLAMGGLSLPQLLRAEAESGVGRSHKSVIMIFLSGGPPHQDMVDLKPDAPVEYRGEFSPISTNVSGMQICELLPLMAQRMDRIATIRSLVGSEGRHASFQCMTGHPVRNQPPGGWPALGAAVSRLKGPVNRWTPAFIGLSPKMRTSTWADPGQAGFAGLAHAPFTPNASGSADLALKDGTLASLGNRRELMQRLDRLRQAMDSNDVIDGMDTYYQQAFDILLSGRLAEALDVEREDERVRERYGRGSPLPAGYGDAGPLLNEYLLAARRLVEAGSRVVTLSFGRWDWHGQPHGTNFDNARDHFPVFDQAVTALLDDLVERGLDQDCSVVVWGEFGRTPRINPKGGRDHWPQVACALLAGGGMRTGQVIGATNERAEHAVERPVHFQEVFATLYHNMGIDPEHTTLPDLSGRPQYLVDHAYSKPLPEVS
ncbi:MAG: DUF1501 domain-containing protein [Planctomycetota bacterium]|nr:MAG: DUF1501 domain-containing protein [Planctomycetota bacterium]REJ96067.1 MAG: DUF1501 domain-containing protein [Planctomycetota bacterium]REK31068.1 MAG: DUF1501 domain-containing protein [Planctomycetota bacterium]REK36818.1 MAG: DUF1501 domain-containing protein [Planctomycetota bacterium]